MFGSQRSGFQKSIRSGTPRRAPKRFTPGVEALERREMPAALAFVSPAGVYGLANLSGSSSAKVRSLTASNSGNIVSRSSGWSDVYAALANYSGASSYKTVTTDTHAYASQTSRQSLAEAWSTLGSSTYSYVSVRVVATSGEQQGQAVKVTLTPRFVSTIGQFGSGSAYNSYNFFLNGTKYLDGKDSTKGTETFKRTLTLNSTVGSSFKIAFQSKSVVGPSDDIGNSTTLQFSIGLSVSGASGGGSSGDGSGGQYSAPDAPRKPTWSSAGGSDIYLQWNGVSGATSYVIQYWNSSTSSWVKLTTVSASTTWIKINYGRGHYWSVGAANAYGTRFSDYVLAN